MSVGVIEINDCGLYCSNTDNEFIVSPGYALLTKQAVITGVAARQKAYLEPQQSFNHYWQQLNLSPLSSPNQYARHNADLAYAQLLQLHSEGGSPEEVVFAVPGSFDRDQLAIILGLANASPFKVLALVDSAVAAVSQMVLINPTTGSNFSQPIVGEILLHLDIQLHQTVLTQLSVANDISREQVDVITDTGLKTFYDSWARFIANKFIAQYRYDPLHTAKGEQQLYDLLPTWLEQLTSDNELAIALDSPQGSYRLNINRTDLLTSSQSKLERLQHRINNTLDNKRLIASHRIKLLPGLMEYLSIIDILPSQTAIAGCFKNIEHITSHDQHIRLITQLPYQQRKLKDTPIKSPVADIAIADTSSTPQHPTAPRPEQQTIATQPTGHQDNNQVIEDPVETTISHLLYQHRAYAIGRQLYIHQQGQDITFSHQQSSDTKLFLDQQNQLRLQSVQRNISNQNTDQPLQLGDCIKIGHHQLQLIEVSPIAPI